MKSLFAIISSILLASPTLLAEDSVGQKGEAAKGQPVESDTSPSVPPPDQARFEYTVLVLESDETSMESSLNKLGRQGWELVTVTSVFIPGSGSINRAYLKRLVRDPKPQSKQ